MSEKSNTQDLIQSFLNENNLRTQDLELFLNKKGIVTITEEEYEKLEYRDE